MLLSILYPTCLTLHIAGLTMMAGTTLVDTIVYRQFWKQYRQDASRATATLEATGKVSVLFALGFLLLLVSGVSMMLLTNGIFAEQLWFKIKMYLVIAVVINGIAVGRRTGLQIRKAAAGLTGNTAALSSLKKRLLFFHVIQLTIFALIFIMGVFKFN
ncbi:MAG TPA: DUF2269 family protein [Chitinophagaceae bacterium]|nr:DUF2269 family protein [Chitinophagaceae bacterium]